MKYIIMQFIKQVLLVNLVFPCMAYAGVDRAWPIITFTCDQVKKEVKLKNEVKWGTAGEKFPFSTEQGTYNPWDLVDIKDYGERKLVSGKSELVLKCNLGPTKYTFLVKPKIFNPNFNGKCGDRLSVKVTIRKNSSTLIENKDMESFCHGNTPVLRGIKVIGANSKVKLYKVARSRFY